MFRLLPLMSRWCASCTNQKRYRGVFAPYKFRFKFVVSFAILPRWVQPSPIPSGLILALSYSCPFLVCSVYSNFLSLTCHRFLMTQSRMSTFTMIFHPNIIAGPACCLSSPCGLHWGSTTVCRIFCVSTYILQ